MGCWLQQEVERRQLFVTDGPSEFKAWMKVVDKFSKVVIFFFAAGSCTCDVVNISFVEVRLLSGMLLEDLLFDVADEQTSVVRS